MYIYVYIYICMHIYIHICVCIYIYSYIYIYMVTHVGYLTRNMDFIYQIYINIYKYIYIYMYIYREPREREMCCYPIHRIRYVINHIIYLMQCIYNEFFDIYIIYINASIEYIILPFDIQS